MPHNVDMDRISLVRATRNGGAAFCSNTRDWIGWLDSEIRLISGSDLIGRGAELVESEGLDAK